MEPLPKAGDYFTPGECCCPTYKVLDDIRTYDNNLHDSCCNYSTYHFGDFHLDFDHGNVSVYYGKVGIFDTMKSLPCIFWGSNYGDSWDTRLSLNEATKIYNVFLDERNYLKCKLDQKKSCRKQYYENERKTSLCGLRRFLHDIFE